MDSKLKLKWRHHIPRYNKTNISLSQLLKKIVINLNCTNTICRAAKFYFAISVFLTPKISILAKKSVFFHVANKCMYIGKIRSLITFQSHTQTIMS